MEKRAFWLMSAIVLFVFGVSGCQSCGCGEEATDEQASAGPQRKEGRQPQPGREDQRVSLENYEGTPEADRGGQVEKRDVRGVDLSGMPLVEPVETAGKSKAPPATLRITGYLKKLQEEEKRRKGSDPDESISTVSPPEEVPPPPRGRGKKAKLSKKPPRGVPKARPGKDVRRGPGGGSVH